MCNFSKKSQPILANPQDKPENEPCSAAFLKSEIQTLFAGQIDPNIKISANYSRNYPNFEIRLVNDNGDFLSGFSLEAKFPCPTSCFDTIANLISNEKSVKIILIPPANKFCYEHVKLVLDHTESDYLIIHYVSNINNFCMYPAYLDTSVVPNKFVRYYTDHRVTFESL